MSTPQTIDAAASREPAIALPPTSALLLIDIQRGFAPAHWEHWAGPGGRRNNPDAERVAGRLLDAWRERGLPVVHVRHDSVSPGSPLHPGAPGNEPAPEVRPRDAEPRYPKHVNSAFIGTTLEADLRARGIDTLVIAGITTPHCVSTTTRMAGNLGFTAYLVADATAAFDTTGPDGARYPAQLMHDTALASLHGEFATVVDSATILAALGADRSTAARGPSR